MITKNINKRFNELANELNKLLCLAGNNSPINKNGIVPNPMENPIMNIIKLISGRYLEKNGFKNQFLVLALMVKSSPCLTQFWHLHYLSSEMRLPWSTCYNS